MRWFRFRRKNQPNVISLEDDESFMELERRLEEARKELEKVLTELEKLRHQTR